MDFSLCAEVVSTFAYGTSSWAWCIVVLTPQPVRLVERSPQDLVGPAAEAELYPGRTLPLDLTDALACILGRDDRCLGIQAEVREDMQARTRHFVQVDAPLDLHHPFGGFIVRARVRARWSRRVQAGVSARIQGGLSGPDFCECRCTCVSMNPGSRYIPSRSISFPPSRAGRSASSISRRGCRRS